MFLWNYFAILKKILQVYICQDIRWIITRNIQKIYLYSLHMQII